MSLLTIYTWGYWGWGNAAEHLIKAFDSVERQRKRKRPYFVDIRISRSVRAKEFRGDAFASFVGKTNYEHMPALGNLAAAPEATISRTTIADPTKVRDLLATALRLARKKTSVVLFCSCKYPHRCHRHMVAELLAREARTRGIQVEVVEWPGDAPSKAPHRLRLDGNTVRRLQGGTLQYVRLGTFAKAEQFVGLPWGSTIAVEGDAPTYFLSGPTRFAKRRGKPGYWALPVLIKAKKSSEGSERSDRPPWLPARAADTLQQARKDSVSFRKRGAFLPVVPAGASRKSQTR